MKISLAEFKNLPHDSADFDCVESGRWSHDNDDEVNEFVVKHNSDGKLFMGWMRRSGSPWTDWYYEYDEDKDGMCELVEVEKVAVITYEWRPVSESLS